MLSAKKRAFCVLTMAIGFEFGLAACAPPPFDPVPTGAVTAWAEECDVYGGRVCKGDFYVADGKMRKVEDNIGLMNLLADLKANHELGRITAVVRHDGDSTDYAVASKRWQEGR